MKECALSKEIELKYFVEQELRSVYLAHLFLEVQLIFFKN